MESGEVIISRAKNNIRFPARFQFVSAMNPCPCGHYGDPEIECRCSPADIVRYQKKISGPLLDRIDIQVNVPRIKYDDLKNDSVDDLSHYQKMISAANCFRDERLKKFDITVDGNAHLSAKQCDKTIQLSKEAEEFIKKIFDSAHISGRGYYRLLKISRTIADLALSDIVQVEHITEAFQYRLRSGFSR
jgi:magnesium chelatase family protein